MFLRAFRRSIALHSALTCLLVAATSGFLAPATALAACTSTAPASSTTVTCTGASTAGVIADASTGVILDVVTGGSIIPTAGFAVDLGASANLTFETNTTTGNASLANQYAILLNDGSTVKVDGLIQGQGGITGTVHQPSGLTGFANSHVTIDAAGEILTSGTANNAAINGRGGGNVYVVDGTVRATGTSGQGIQVGDGDQLTVGATGNITTLSGDTASTVTNTTAAGVIVVTDPGSLIELHGIGRGIQLGSNANVTVGGTIRSYGDTAGSNSAGGGGVDVNANSTVWLKSTGSIITGNTVPSGNKAFTGNGGTGANGITAVSPSVGGFNTFSNATIIVDGLIDTQKGNGVTTRGGDHITIGATGKITTRGSGTPISISPYTSVGNDQVSIDIFGRVEQLGTGKGIFITASPGQSPSADLSMHANVTIEASGSLYAQGGKAYTQDDGAGSYPEVTDNLIVAGDVETGVANGVAIDLNDGADTITLLPTYKIVGSINGGTDAASQPETDTFAFDGGSGTIGTFDFGVNPITNFEAGHKIGLGTWILKGAAGAGLAGAFAVDAGRLQVDGALANASMNVASGATLAGNGSIGNAVTIANGGNLEGKAGQTLTMGALTLNSASNLYLSLGAPSATRLLNVTGNLVLDGVADISSTGSFGPGVYRLFDYGGTLTNNGLQFDLLPYDYLPADLAVQTSIANQVNIVVAAATGPRLQFWDGSTTAPTGTIAGGTGTWTVAPITNWTNASATRADQWFGDIAVFEATPGVVTVSNGGGAVTTRGMQFVVDGYSVVGATLGLNGDAGSTGVRVGDGSLNGAAYSATIASVLSGNSALHKTDLGRLVLSGTNTYSGATEVAAGTLEIDGSIANSNLSVDAGATLKGIGTLGTATSGTILIAAGATHAPGHSIGTQTIIGNYVNHGTLEIEAQPGSADQVRVTGNVAVTGAALHVMELTATGWQPSQGYIIIDNQGLSPVAGTFASISNIYPFLTPSVDYSGGTGNDVMLSLARNDLDFAALARTRNQVAAAQGAQSLGMGKPLYDAIVPLTTQLAPDAFDQISGEIYATTNALLIEASGDLRDLGLARARLAARDPGGRHIWTEAIGAGVILPGDGNAAAAATNSGAVFVGADAAIDRHLLLGAFAGVGQTDLSIPDRRSTATSRDYSAGVYGAGDWQWLRLRFGASVTSHAIATRRQPSFSGFTDATSVDYGATTGQVFGEIGHAFDLGGATVEPFVGLAQAYQWSDALSETGGPAALSSGAGTTSATIATLGVHASHQWLAGGVPVDAEATLAWQHAIADLPTASNSFSGGSAFTVAGAPVAGDALVLKAGLTLHLSPSSTLGLAYSGRFSGGAMASAVSAKFSASF